jgi:hypothetical protein
MKLFIFLFSFSLYAAQPIDVVQEVRKAALKGPPCYVSMSLNDSLGKPYCFICKSDTIRISIKRTSLSSAEISRINRTATWLDSLK